MSRIQKVPAPPPPPVRVWTSLDLIRWTTDFFQKKGLPSPRLEAELLLAGVLECTRIQLYVNFEKPVAPDKLAKFREYVRRRGEAREPLQYIQGWAAFIDLRLKVTPAVLIPRPETELLAQWALAKISPLAEGPVALDLCTGSGCLALYLASKEPRAQVVATDLSAAALSLAAENARTLQLESRVTFHAGDLFAAMPDTCRGKFDLVVSNPPYIDAAVRETLPPEVREHEPAEALFAGEQGLAVLRRLIAGAPEWLKAGGWLGLEFGAGQGEALVQMAAARGAYQNTAIVNDQAQVPRYLVAQKA